MATTNPYKTLGVRPKSSREAITKAYSLLFLRDRLPELPGVATLELTYWNDPERRCKMLYLDAWLADRRHFRYAVTISDREYHLSTPAQIRDMTTLHVLDMAHRLAASLEREPVPTIYTTGPAFLYQPVISADWVTSTGSPLEQLREMQQRVREMELRYIERSAPPLTMAWGLATAPPKPPEPEPIPMTMTELKDLLSQPTDGVAVADGVKRRVVFNAEGGFREVSDN